MYPTVTLQPKLGKRLKAGHPWVYSNEVVMDAAAKALKPGSVVEIRDSNGVFLALAHFNPHTLIAGRVLARMNTDVNVDFWKTRLEEALHLRTALVDVPYYRLIHAEADKLPGLIIDRFGEGIVVQANTAGMQNAKDDLLAACEAVLNPSCIIWRGDTPSRALEGLADDVSVVKGDAAAMRDVRENGIVYKADALGGQKTGWFYDQRRNRALVAQFARDKSVLDLYTHTGGFGLLAASRGARAVACVDRSDHALALAKETATANGLTTITFEKADIFEYCEAAKGKRFDVVIADPPAFAKSKKDVGPASRGYRKLARLASALVEKNGFFFMASCSHAITRERFDEEVVAGVHDAGRECSILARTGADLDHPTHPFLPESSYLKGILLHVR